MGAAELLQPALPEIAGDVAAGLRSYPKSLPPWLFYDARGSSLFEEVTRLPEYHLTRAEHEILETHASAILDCAGSNLALIELGAGTAETYPGGHGPMWDLAESPVSIALLESFYNSGKPIALVCHSPGVLRHVTYKGEPLVKGKRVTGFTNGEEEEVKLTKVVPFLVEDELLRLGATFEKVRNWQPFSIVDGRLITGQNPASSTSAAQSLVKLLAAEKAA